MAGGEATEAAQGRVSAGGNVGYEPMTKWRSAALVVSVLSAGAALVFWSLRNEPGITAHREFNARLKCRSCGHDYAATLQVSDAPPYACSSCGQREAWRLKRCRACAHTFMPEPSGDPPRQPMMPECPRCASKEVGSAPVNPVEPLELPTREGQP